MIIFKHPLDIQNHLLKIKKRGKSIGFVPTMGALHDGHMSLIGKSRESNDFTVSSIFVNPVQFNNPEDFINYPSTLTQDILALEQAGCNFLFLPSESDIYPDSSSKMKKYDLGRLDTILEGKFRPGHFQGVCLVVERLLDILQPDNLFLGQKDFQQCLVIERLTAGMDKPIGIHVCPIVREEDGLAMSSRNLRLNKDQRARAPRLFEALSYIKNHLQSQNFTKLRTEALHQLGEAGFNVEYLELADSRSLALLSNWSPGIPGIILVAAFLDNIRLIDNLLTEV